MKRIYRIAHRVRHPMCWSVGVRRAFLIALPLTLPVYLLLVLATVLLTTGADVADALRPFWSAPRRSLGRRYFYG